MRRATGAGATRRWAPAPDCLGSVPVPEQIAFDDRRTHRRLGSLISLLVNPLLKRPLRCGLTRQNVHYQQHESLRGEFRLGGLWHEKPRLRGEDASVHGWSSSVWRTMLGRHFSLYRPPVLAP